MANDPHFFLASTGGGASVGELSLEPGLVLGNKYRLLRPAGFGGMGAVWVARNEATAAEVVVKVLVTARQGVDQEAIARFRREAHMAAQLYHRGIVRIFDLVELSFSPDDFDSSVRHAGSMEGPRPPDALVLVMELLRGETLASRMDEKVRFTQEEALGIVLPLLSALAHAHAKGIVHRDLKPENVFLSVDPDGHVIPKILDFGISKLLQPAAPRITTDGAMLGTPSYMSPEQARGLANVDARADVFAAGILLYECIAGENPFASGSYHSVVAAILEREPPVLKAASPEVWRVIKRALEKVPAHRYANAAELAQALVAAAQIAVPAESVPSGAFPARPVDVEGSVPPAPFREPGLTLPSMRVEGKKRHRARATVGAVAIAVALGVAAGFYTSTRPVHGFRHLVDPTAPSSEGAREGARPASPTEGVRPAAPSTAPAAAETSSAPPPPELAATVTAAPPLPVAPPAGVESVAPPRTAAAAAVAPVQHPAPSPRPVSRPKGVATAPAPAPAATPPPVVHGVVRDPGF